MTVKDYGSLPEKNTKPSFVFSLGGREWHCKPAQELPLSIIDLWAAPGTKKVQVGTFFQTVLVPDEVDEFMELVESARSPLTFANADVLVNDAIEALAGRPTKRPASSQAGPRSTKANSAGASSSRGTRNRK